MSRRRPVFGWIAFALVVAAYLVAAGAVVYGYVATQGAFEQGAPWWTVTASIAPAPVGVLCVIGLALGITGAARREAPGWPAITAMILALPGFGYVAIAAYVWFVVTTACGGPDGACAL